MVSQRWRKGDVIREISYSWLLNPHSITTDARFHFIRPMAHNSPDLNPADYSILGEMTKVYDVDEVKQLMSGVA